MIDIAQDATALSSAAMENLSQTTLPSGTWASAALALDESPVRLWKVERLRSAIALGTYGVSAKRIAQAMISRDASRRLSVLRDDSPIH